MNNLLIITWVSASGKTSIQEELLKRWWVRPINFTTRKPRSDEELDEYVFLDKDKYFIKLWKWDFLEHTNYNWNWYGVSKYLPNWNVCIVLDPVGREQVLEKIAREWLKYNVTCVYLEIDKKLQTERLNKRWDSPEQKKLRSVDFQWFSPNGNSLIFNWAEDIEVLANKIECEALEMTIHSE